MPGNTSIYWRRIATANNIFRSSSLNGLDVGPPFLEGFFIDVLVTDSMFGPHHACSALPGTNAVQHLLCAVCQKAYPICCSCWFRCCKQISGFAPIGYASCCGLSMYAVCIPALWAPNRSLSWVDTSMQAALPAFGSG